MPVGLDRLPDRAAFVLGSVVGLAVATLVGYWNGEVDFTSGSWAGDEAGTIPSDD